MSKKKQFFGLGAIVLLIFGLWSVGYKQDTHPLNELALTDKDQPTLKLTVGSSTINAYVASTPETQERGLSGRKNLAIGEGMWFVFTKPEFYAFWMPDMYFAIDIIWVDSRFQIIDITRNVTPESYPHTFSPKTPAQYVLEVPSGYTSQSNIVVGMSIKVD